MVVALVEDRTGTEREAHGAVVHHRDRGVDVPRRVQRRVQREHARQRGGIGTGDPERGARRPTVTGAIPTSTRGPFSEAASGLTRCATDNR